jgi:hypothetical protein
MDKYFVYNLVFFEQFNKGAALNLLFIIVGCEMKLIKCCSPLELKYKAINHAHHSNIQDFELA